MHRLNWDDLRFVLAVAETGSVSAAARTLGVNHATVLRRVSSFEESCGGPVFEKNATGYKLRTDRAPVIEAARQAAHQVQSVERLMRGSDVPSGTVLRVTSTDTLCQTVLAWILPALSRRVAPDRVSYVVSNAHLDMARLRADLSVRPAQSLTEELTGQQIGEMRFAVYRRAGSTSGKDWLGLSGALSRSVPARWLANEVEPNDILTSADSFCTLAEIAAAGSGRVILPCILGDSHKGLERETANAVPDLVVPIWVACHQDVAGSDRIRTCIGAVAKLVRQHKARLAGTI